MMTHFCIPLSNNILSAVIIIWRNARRRSSTQVNLVFREILGTQYKEHRHRLITPMLIIALSIPRLIISIVSGCIQSGRSTWLYLAGYLISFSPTMLTCVLFVLPSNLYKRGFQQSSWILMGPLTPSG